MHTLPKQERLRGRERLEQLFGDGGKGIAGRILARALPNDGGPARVAAVAGKRLGGAVERNRMRRRLRAVYRTNKERLPQGWDFALVARAGLLEAAWQDVTKDVETAMQRAVKDYSGRRQPRPAP